MLQCSAVHPLSPTTLQLLAPLLHGVGFISRYGHHADDEASSAVTSAHIASLQHCNRFLASLCIQEWAALPDQLTHRMADSMEDIAQLSGLTKLHVSFMGYEGFHSDLEPLSQLTMLQDLGLYTHDHLDSCDAVLCSSMQSLRHINLLAARFSSATYQALQQMPHLDRLKISLCASISRREAVGMVGIRAKHFHLQLTETDSLGFCPNNSRRFMSLPCGPLTT